MSDAKPTLAQQLCALANDEEARLGPIVHDLASYLMSCAKLGMKHVVSINFPGNYNIVTHHKNSICALLNHPKREMLAAKLREQGLKIEYITHRYNTTDYDFVTTGWWVFSKRVAVTKLVPHAYEEVVVSFCCEEET